MASFNVIGISGACGGGTSFKTYTYRYAEGSIVYSLAKAARGIIHPIAIKAVKLKNLTQPQVTAIYVDTYNSLWNEDMLCTESEAQQVALSYLESEEEKRLNGIITCGS